MQPPFYTPVIYYGFDGPERMPECQNVQRGANGTHGVYILLLILLVLLVLLVLLLLLLLLLPRLLLLDIFMRMYCGMSKEQHLEHV